MLRSTSQTFLCAETASRSPLLSKKMNERSAAVDVDVDVGIDVDVDVDVDANVDINVRIR